MASFGAAKSLKSVVRGAAVVVRGSLALLGLGVGVGLVAAPVWWVRDIMLRDVSAVPVVVALNGGAGNGGGVTPAATDRRAEPALPRPVEAAVRTEAPSRTDAETPTAPRETGAVSRSPMPRPRPARGPAGEDWTWLAASGGAGHG